MKATTIILAALFTLQVSALFADNESTTPNGSPVEAKLNITALIPVTPAEATFEDVIIEIVDLTALAPVVPLEAEFEDMIPMADLTRLAPLAPSEADFSDL